MANIVKFYSLTPSEYNIIEKNNNHLYFVVETNSNIGALYKGSSLITDNYALETIKQEILLLEEIVQGHLEFSAELEERLSGHINDSVVHITAQEREKWNNKVSYSVEGEQLILTL